MIKINKPVDNYLIFTYDFFIKLKELSIDKLKKTIDRSSGDDLIKIQKRHQQIGNLLNMRVSKLL